MDSMLEKGAKVSFEDEKAVIFNGRLSVTETSLLEINNVNMLTWFPGAETTFPYAAAKAKRTAATAPSSTPASPPQSAEERRIADLEAELQRLKQGR